MNALHKIKTDLVNICSYDSDWFLNDYRYYHKKNQTDKVDLIVFSEKHQRNLDTACIAIGDYNMRKSQLHIFDLAKRFALTTAPYSFIINDNLVSFYLNKEINTPLLEDECAVSEFAKILTKHRNKYEPERLLLQKRSPHSLQLKLFAEQATRESLISVFEDTEANAIKQFKISESEKERSSFLNLIFQVFAAKVLEDKRIISGKADNINELLINAHNKFNRYFNFKAFEDREWEIAKFIFLIFNQHNIIFDCVTNEMLGSIYETLLVKKKTRELLKIHYTPPKIAKELVERIPFENIHPEKLHVLDTSSGSGTLLIAACQRIKAILPVNESQEEQHEYITSHIHGIDKDLRSVGLAKLQLLLNNLPNGNSWDIQNHDFLEIKSLDFQPTVILTNPPFGEKTRGKARFELAARFFEKCSDLLIDGGYIGILLPASFRDKNTCQKLRNKLIENFDLLELWDLPRHIFKYSDATINVLIAQKIKRNLQFPIRSRYVHHDSRNDYLESGKINYSYLSNTKELLLEEQKLTLVGHPMQHILMSISKRCNRTIGALTEIYNGIKPGAKGRRECVAEDKYMLKKKWGEKDYDFWLNGARNCLEPFLINWDKQIGSKYIYYEPSLIGEGSRKEHEDDFRKPGKIIINTNRPPDTGWRIYGAIDEGIDGKGFFPSNGLYCIKPKSDVSLEEIVSVINSPVSNVFIDYLTRKQQFSRENVESIPFPNFSEEERDQIISIVQSIMQLKKSNDNIKNTQKLISDLDKLIFTAYGITKFEEQEILTFLGGNNKRPGQEWKPKYLDEKRAIIKRPEFSDQEFNFERYQKSKIITGSTIDVKSDKIRLFLIGVDGFDYEDEKWISIPPAMPGWALRPGVSFEVYLESDLISNIDLKDNSLSLWGFKPLTSNYMNDEELLENISTIKSNK